MGTLHLSTADLTGHLDSFDNALSAVDGATSFVGDVVNKGTLTAAQSITVEGNNITFKNVANVTAANVALKSVGGEIHLGSADGTGDYTNTTGTKYLYKLVGNKEELTSIKDGLDRKAFDATGTFHKSINEDFMMAYLTGSWDDSNNNSWSFGYVEKDGEPCYQYRVLLASGDYHESDPGYGPWAHYTGDTVYGSLAPYFDGASTVYKITGLTADTVTMRDEVGEITMTRSW